MIMHFIFLTIDEEETEAMGARSSCKYLTLFGTEEKEDG